MRFAHAPVIIAIAACLGACSHTTSRDSASPPWVNATEPIGPGPARSDLVVLLPSDNGSVGAVVVRSDGGAIVLDKPYAAARIEDAGRVQPFTYDANLARQEFSATLTALPARPVMFLLFFLEGKDELTADSEREVDRIFAEIAARPDPEVSVIGHTDAVGTMQYNDQLSLQRAQRVREDLTRRGIPDQNIQVAGRGKREPVVTTAGDAPEPMNRRVEIIVR